VTKGLTIPKFGVLSFSSSTSTVYAVCGMRGGGGEFSD
jgi:hypothetical protein